MRFDRPASGICLRKRASVALGCRVARVQYCGLMTSPGKPTVLIVDDDQVVSQQLVSLLRAAGYPAKSTLDPVQGFMAAQRERPGLILLDINLPAGGGVRMLERLIKTT